jgi:hypothetical protein
MVKKCGAAFTPSGILSMPNVMKIGQLFEKPKEAIHTHTDRQTHTYTA